MKPVTIDLVRRALSGPRPGRAAQARMVPRPRPGDLLPPPPEHPRREAGVLILLYLKDQALHFVLTLRTNSVELHKGQISLPGGAREGTERLDETARRETSEELGVDPACVELLGPPLTPLYIPVSDFWVTAFVGYWTERRLFRPEPGEVVETIETPLALLLDPETLQEGEWEIRGERVHVPFFHIYGHKVWGATAMMLSEFRALLTE